jgi:hypothetical protein
MKSLPRLLVLLLAFAGLLHASDDAVIAALRAADDERVAAIVAADGARLDAIFSDELRYAHSNGKIDTKASYRDSLVSRTTVYAKYDYAQRDFKLVAPTVALMTGRAVLQSGPAGAVGLVDLNFLAVWRLENGHWRFLSWQSCRNPAPAK